MSNKRSVISTLNRLTDRWGAITIDMSAEGVVEIYGSDPLHDDPGTSPTLLARSFTGLVDAVKEAREVKKGMPIAVED